MTQLHGQTPLRVSGNILYLFLSFGCNCIIINIKTERQNKPNVQKLNVQMDKHIECLQFPHGCHICRLSPKPQLWININTSQISFFNVHSLHSHLYIHTHTYMQASHTPPSEASHKHTHLTGRASTERRPHTAHTHQAFTSAYFLFLHLSISIFRAHAEAIPTYKLSPR